MPRIFLKLTQKHMFNSFTLCVDIKVAHKLNVFSSFIKKK